MCADLHAGAEEDERLLWLGTVLDDAEHMWGLEWCLMLITSPPPPPSPPSSVPLWLPVVLRVAWTWWWRLAAAAGVPVLAAAVAAVEAPPPPPGRGCKRVQALVWPLLLITTLFRCSCACWASFLSQLQCCCRFDSHVGLPPMIPAVEM